MRRRGACVGLQQRKDVGVRSGEAGECKAAVEPTGELGEATVEPVVEAAVEVGAATRRPPAPTGTSPAIRPGEAAGEAAGETAGAPTAESSFPISNIQALLVAQMQTSRQASEVSTASCKSR